MTKREMTIEEAIEIFKEVRKEVIAKETELSRQVFENLGIKAIDLAIKALERETILDKIKAEIIELRSKQNVGVLECLDIIDKYKAKSEDEEE